MPEQKSKQSSTQLYLPIAEIRDNTVVLKNGGLRAVLQTTSVNFNLKSEDEQNSIIFSYQGFINSLEFPVQILIKSKKLDLDDYIEQVNQLGDKQENKLLQDQTYEYAQYIKRLIEYADIMEKKFYVIVPMNPGRAVGVGFISGFFQRMAPKQSFTDIVKRHKEFEELRKKLNQRVNIIRTGLEGCGLKVNELTTPELIELFYNCYNPKSSQTAKLKDLYGTSIQTDEEKIDEMKIIEKQSEEKIEEKEQKK